MHPLGNTYVHRAARLSSFRTQRVCHQTGWEADSQPAWHDPAQLSHLLCSVFTEEGEEEGREWREKEEAFLFKTNRYQVQLHAACPDQFPGMCYLDLGRPIISVVSVSKQRLNGMQLLWLLESKASQLALCPFSTFSIPLPGTCTAFPASLHVDPLWVFKQARGRVLPRGRKESRWWVLFLVHRRYL